MEARANPAGRVVPAVSLDEAARVAALADEAWVFHRVAAGPLRRQLDEVVAAAAADDLRLT